MRVRELAGVGEVALVPSHNAGVGGWCVVRLPGGGGGECSASQRPAEAGRGSLQGPILVESGHRIAFLEKRRWVSGVVALVQPRVAAVSFQGYGRIATRTSALLPDHLRGAVIRLSSPLRSPGFPLGNLIAWSGSGKRIPQTFTKGRSLTFGMPVRRWSNGIPAPRGVCEISVRGVGGLEPQSGGVVSEVEPHADVLGREFLDCAHSYYLLNQKWPLDAYVLLDAAHPGTTPAPLPGMRPLAQHRGVFIGPDPESGELARRVPGAWLVVAAGEGVSQRLVLLKHLHATLHLP